MTVLFRSVHGTLSRAGRERRRILSLSCQTMRTPCRVSRKCHSTTTVDLVSMDADTASQKKAMTSLILSTVEQDVPCHQSMNIHFPRNKGKKTSQLRDLLAAASLENPKAWIEAKEMGLVQAAERRRLFDKIVLLVLHGEGVDPALDAGDHCLGGEDPESLTAKGIGQSLTLSRRMAAFCNVESELIPDLVLVAPVKRVLQTTFLAFPYQTPQHAIRSTRWICHPKMLDQGKTEKKFTLEMVKNLQREFRGVDCSLLEDSCSSNTNNKPVLSGGRSEEVLMEQADDFLLWLKNREERLVVGKLRAMRVDGLFTLVHEMSAHYSNSMSVAGEETWLNCLGRRLNLQHARVFQYGDLRAFGLNFH